MRVQTGLDRLATDVELQKRVHGRKTGLLAHPASVAADYRHALSIIEPLVDLQVVFGPEHGYAGTAQDMIGVDGESAAGHRVVSLYGETAADLSPKTSDLEGLDLIIVDLQDVGARFYTYVWTTAFVLRVAARMGIEVMVLDRPNPLGGEVTEGAPQGPAYRSFVGLYPVPVRHALTIGELMKMVVEFEKLDPACLSVVEMMGWERKMLFADTGLPWVLTSPNMATTDTATVYPGGCIIEGTTLSEGRGTTRPFEIFGAPGVDGVALARDLETPGAVLRPLTFEPTVRKFAGELCGGVQVHVTNPHLFRSVSLYYRLIAAMMVQRGHREPWRTEVYEYDFRRPAIDLLTGAPAYRQLVNRMLNDQQPLEAIEDYLQDDETKRSAFDGSRFHLYG
ncbi:MAG: hypothetical protein ACI9KE_002619 [Polyangiales bacterium]|jgi:uncharacterized protein YbbC (DUF1343 family)